MDWISNLFCALLLTNISGTLFYVIGIIFRKIWFRRDVRLIRFSTLVVLCAYIMPVVYFIIRIDRQVKGNQRGSVNMFYNTPQTIELFAIMGWVWVILFLALLAYKLYRRHKWTRVWRGNIPEEDEATKRYFSEICAELGIEGKVSLARNDSVDMPCITYYHGMVVILPLNKYTEEETQVILYHELCHYVEKDMSLKALGIIVSLLHVFNPVVHVMLRQMSLICEISCDRMACERSGDRFSEQIYFQTILDMVNEDKKRERYQLFALADDRSNYERRVAAMGEYRKKGGFRKGGTIILTVAFLLGSSFSSLAAGAELANAYEGYAHETKVRTSLGSNIDEIDLAAIEDLAMKYNIDPEDIVIMDDVNMNVRGRTITLNWNVLAGKTFMTSGFSEDVGDEVEAWVVATPADRTFETGLKDPDNIMHYAEGSDTIYFKYEIEDEGRYYFYVYNPSETEDLGVDALIKK